MKWMKTILIAFALVAGTSGIAAAQDGYNRWQNRPYDRDGDHNRDGDRAAQWGYQQDHDGDRDDGYRNNRGVYGSYNQNPYYNTGIRSAQQNGYQWGLRDGQVDRQAGRSYRATSNETYKHATIGYVSAYGDKNQYKSVFRQSYQEGYQRGYGSGAYGQARRWPWGR